MGQVVFPYTLRPGDASLEAKLERLDRDPHRPRFHFLPTAGEWMNDVHPFFWKGTYHAFFQYAHTSNWGLRMWGHARSSDLVHWEQVPNALNAGPEWYDKDTVASGCLVEHEGKVHILYTGISRGPEKGTANHQRQCEAVAESDDLIVWKKNPSNPLMDSKTHLAPPYTARCWCDPEVWKEGSKWHMLLGCSLEGVGAYSLYSSADLKHWDYESCFWKTHEFDFLDYPHFFRLDGKEVLMWDNGGTVTNFEVGRVENGVFHSQRRTPYDPGLSCAGKSLVDDRGRRIMMSYVLEDRFESADTSPESIETGWAGLMSLPRLLHVDEDGAVRQEPVPELKGLRGAHVEVPGFEVPPGDRLLDGIQGDCLEIIARFRLKGARQFGIMIRCAPDLSEQSRIIVDAERKKLVFDSRRGTLNNLKQQATVLELDYDPASQDYVELRVFVDRSVVEVFANRNRGCITGRTYPSRSDSVRVGIFSSGGGVTCERISVWKMEALSSIQAPP